MKDVIIPAKTEDLCAFGEKLQTYSGCADGAARFLQKEQLCDASLWKRFVQQFRDQIDGDNRGWRGEYWGKMMRGAAFVYEYTHDETLYNVLTETVRDMFTAAEEDGRVSSFTRDTEFDAWDLWGRKYVFLGMEYYYDICKDETLKKEIVQFLCRMADYIVRFIGNGEGQKSITVASRHWRGVNSSSILEPMVWLYRLTGEQRYFDFATYIIENGGAEGINIFELAYENKLAPYQYGVTKAYETISCFEGLIEYYRITGIEKYLVAAVNFGKAIIDTDVTVIGTCGCTHELFDHSTARQTAFYEGIMQETCVTVTWMKYCSQLLRLTGERVFADCIEQSFYNAYLGALNTEYKTCPYTRKKFAREGNDPADLVDVFFPFDSYS
ncbi:MAG: glycoside hydrolase family 127 protein, partial [Clostridia bacterium]|nr:glycoside hydrolase family 127 protein [Clostridia bacterium]